MALATSPARPLPVQDSLLRASGPTDGLRALRRVVKDGVDVWTARVDGALGADTTDWALLAADEVARAERYCFATDRDRFVARRALRRAVLAAYVGVDPRRLRFMVQPAGKPELLDTPWLHFSESESAGLAAVAVTRTAPIGVDVEQVRETPAASAIIERFGNPREKRWWRRVPPTLRPYTFFRWWTAKEAFMKATGSGLGQRLDSFSVDVRGRRLRLVLANSASSHSWRLRELELGPGFVGALVSR